jgi:hypothetical protein
MKILILKILKILMPILATVNLFIWVIQIFSEKLFNFLDRFFGFLPHVFDNTLGIATEINDKEILMGYIFAGFFYILLFGIFYVIEKKEKEKIKQKKAEDTKTNIVKAKKARAKNKDTVRTEAKPQLQYSEDNLDGDINAFYGLLTFELKYLDDKEIEEDVQKTIKHSYTKIIVEKLKEKYDSINYAVSDKVFFICNNVSLFNLFVRDIVQLNKVIAKISEKQMIKTALKLCFWASPKANPKKACATLLRINNLNYLNKVIVSKHIQKKFDRQLIKCFDFCTLGNVKLTKLNSKDDDINMELFYLKTMDD